MTTKLSEPMQNVLIKLEDGGDGNDFSVHGLLTYAARERTCKALAKLGLVAHALGDYDLTEAGEALVKQLNDQAKAVQPPISRSY
ncbi:hypothetical protein ACIQVE_01805 [Pseudomonas sp. NPDC098747]|uniref:hypothetical protein n=1 Tax=Pseudomonas sp. NPDC098747 TaxID=3364487 RepID=UPI00383B45E0